MTHLGERLTALVDGELDHEERDRALAHLAVCADCRAEADQMRRLKRRLRSLGDVAPPPGLEGLLRGMDVPFTPPDLVPAAFFTGSTGSTGSTARTPQRPGARRPADTRPGGRAVRRRTRTRTILAGAATFAVFGVGGASYALGGTPVQPQSTPRVTPSVERLAVEHALTSGEAPDRAAAAVTGTPTVRVGAARR